jgi:hypothetical protein
MICGPLFRAPGLDSRIQQLQCVFRIFEDRSHRLKCELQWQLNLLNLAGLSNEAFTSVSEGCQETGLNKENRISYRVFDIDPDSHHLRMLRESKHTVL